MEKKNNTFQIKRTFGLGVLLKLTKTNVQGLNISTDGVNFIADRNLDQMTQAVEATLAQHNIALKCE
ncbi:MAG: hypothetical protein MI749_11415 [Desulfovibrionales bacterium]|nr:hypothetical protein [Desulfovibrionales bacterium]